jgi:predicted phage-related endonuclease
MKIIDLVQGTDSWHQHRAQHLNASEAPVMLGEFPAVTRSELLKVRATGVESEISWFLQQIFDDGHRFEALARPLAEAIIGEDLYPCVGVQGKLSASFDGLTMLGDVNWEHKMLNATLRACMVEGCTGADLPLYHQIQMEQQHIVSDADRTLFMASEWDDDGNLIEERHCWYTPNPELRARIVAGWEQFERDVCAYEDKPLPAPVVGRVPQTLPSLNVQVTGMVTASNLAEFRGSALSVLSRINRDLQTDEDFADAEQTVKWCKGVEERLEATKQQILGQTADIDAVFRTMDEVATEARRVRLELDRLVKVEKENRRGQIVASGVQSVREHYDAINATLGQHRIQPPQSLSMDIGLAIKGKKSLASMQDAVGTAAANAKISASQQADRVRACVHVLEMEMGDYAALFPDRVQLCASKTPEDLRNLVTARIAEHKQREQARLDAQREQIRKEEEARAQRLQQEAEAARLAKEQADRQAEEARERALRVEQEQAARAAEPAPQVIPSPATAGVAQLHALANALSHSPHAPAAAAPQRKLRLGEINALIAPLSISADGLAELGFQPVATERASKLYDAAQYPLMAAAMQLRLGESIRHAAQKAAA